MLCTEVCHHISFSSQQKFSREISHFSPNDILIGSDGTNSSPIADPTSTIHHPLHHPQYPRAVLAVAPYCSRQNTSNALHFHQFLTDSRLQRHGEQPREDEMRSRLSNNPHDVQANAYFSEKIRKENVQHQYEQMMEEYPEATGPFFLWDKIPRGCI
jgi:hypothetical protein